MVQGSGAIDYKKAISLSVTATVNPPQDSSQVIYLAPYTGAVAITQAIQNSAVLSTSSFPDLATAISGIGSTKVTLIVNTSVTVAADLTIPSNVAMEVTGSGLITVNSGKRLYINGPFKAPRLQKVFVSSLLSTAITASVSGTALVVTAVSQNVLAEGHVITGSGVLGSQLIFNTYGLTGTGTYSLSNYNGVLGSRSMTAIGPSVIFGAGVIDCVYPQWWGAIADGSTTDNGPAIAQAVYSMPWGGRIHFPAGNYKCLTNHIVGHPQLQITGDGAIDNSTGSPPSVAINPTYIWNGTDNSNLFVFGAGCGNIIIRDIAFGAQQAFGGLLTGPVGTGRKAIVFDGHAPQFVWGLVFENLWFSGLNTAFLVNDSWGGVGDGVGGAGTYWNGSASVTYYDWAVNPARMKNCHFMFNSFAVYFNSGNADAWVLEDCIFILGANSSGVYLQRCGYLKLDNCFAAGISVTQSKFVNMVFVGAASADSVVLDNCQAEACGNFLILDGSSTNDVPPTITVRNSIHQISADISLGKSCDYISQANEIQSSIYILATGIRFHSILDKYIATDFIPGHTTWGPVIAGGDANSIYTYIPGFYPCTSFGGPISRSIWLGSVSADRGDTNQTIVVGVDKQIQRWATVLTANRTVTLSTTGVVPGDSFRIVRTGLGAFTLAVGALKTIPNSTAAFVDVSFDGSAWELTGYGTL